MASRRKRDYYEVLGVDRNADDAALKRAYRELARKYHPDINPGADTEDKFKEVNEAYAILSDPKSRTRYDRYGHAGVDSSEMATGFSGVVDAATDIINDLLRRRRQKKRGRDLRYTLEVTFEEAALGAEKIIEVTSPRKKEFTVTIPPGTKPGALKTLKGEGELGTAGAGPGDLVIILRVKEHAIFRREGNDVWCDVPISFPQASLGAVVEVPTLDGGVKMRIPAGTQSGRVFRIRDRGVPRTASRGGPRGDQMVKVIVETPTNLTQRQRELLEEFARASGDTIAHPQRRGFLDRVKALL